jgi:hypothetical protein
MKAFILAIVFFAAPVMACNQPITKWGKLAPLVITALTVIASKVNSNLP